MITKLTAENNEAYLARLAAISEVVWGDSEHLQSLEEYFAQIEEIAAFALNHKEYTSLCLAMPVDEPTFDIDANSRTITVPSIFKKNGIAVMGDHQAETIYFSIDKYFDYQSFAADNVNIRINWVSGNSGKKGEELTVNTSPAFGPSENLIPGKYVFGWVINNNMTKQVGTLTFSVEIYITDVENKIIYSFNTLPATLNIGTSLTLKDPTQIPVDDTNLLLNRLRNTPYRIDAIEGPTEPVWLSENGLGLPAEISMPFVNEYSAEQEPLTLYAQAGIEKGKTIQYTWEPSVIGEGRLPDVSGEDEYLRSTAIAKPENDAIVAPQDEVLYYIQENDHPETFKLLIGQDKINLFNVWDAYWQLSDEERQETEEPTIIYERFSKFVVNKAGTYRVRANAKVDISNSFAEENLTENERNQLDAITKYIETKDCVVPAATEPVATLIVESQVVVPDINKLSPDDEAYSSTQYTYVDENTTPALKVNLRNNLETTEEFEKDWLGSVAVVMLNADNNKIINTDIDFTEIEESDIIADATADNPLYSFVRYKNDIALTDNINAQGTYKVGVINRLNGTYAKGTSNEIITSFVAPSMNSITVRAADGIEGHDADVLLENGAQPNETMMEVKLEKVNAFLFNDTGDYSMYPGCVKEYYLQEVTPNAEQEGDPVEVQLTSSEFMPHDIGLYRIKVVVKYHNTVNEGYTSVFAVSTNLG